jgi:hypothetical protein
LFRISFINSKKHEVCICSMSGIKENPLLVQILRHSSSAEGGRRGKSGNKCIETDNLFCRVCPSTGTFSAGIHIVYTYRPHSPTTTTFINQIINMDSLFDRPRTVNNKKTILLDHTFCGVLFLKKVERKRRGARGKISIFVRLDHHSVLDMAHNQEEVDHHLC